MYFYQKIKRGTYLTASLQETQGTEEHVKWPNQNTAHKWPDVVNR